MFAKFKYETLPLSEIDLDDRNPRIVTQTKLKSQEEILTYLFEHEDLSAFIKKIAAEGKNPGAERPYVIKKGKKYVVLEGNTRIAAYKVLTGQMKPPKGFEGVRPHVSKTFIKSLEVVDCSLAPDRDALLPIMASSHFGLGDKSKWGYLGSRKAVYDELKAGRSTSQLSKAFNLTPGQINTLILEYQLYLEALALKWTSGEKQVLLDPAVEFNPPVRFLQTKGHKEKVGIKYDKVNLKIKFLDTSAKRKFKHLIDKLVINPQTGLGATASYDAVFADYNESSSNKTSSTSSGSKDGQESDSKGSSKSGETKSKSTGKTKPHTLFSYKGNVNDATLKQLLKEAKDLNCKKYPAAGTGLLRSTIETVLKHMVDEHGANSQNKSIDLEAALNLCQSQSVKIPADDKKVLKEFKKNHLDYLNLGVHGTSVPNYDRLMSARDAIDGFIKRHA